MSDATNTRWLPRLLDSARVGALLRVGTTWKEANPQARELMGLSDDALLQERVGDIVPELENPHPNQVVERWVAGADGKRRYLRFLVDPSGERETLAAWIIDLTNAQRECERATVRESQFLLAFMSNPDPLLITSMIDGVVRAANDAFCANTGYTKDELIGSPTVGAGLWNDPEDRDTFVSLLQQTGQVNNLDVTFRCKNKDTIPVLVSARIIEWNGEPCVYTIGRYIGDIKKAQARQKALEQQLLQTQKLEALGTLAGGIAHDFNNVLHAILSLTRIAIEELEESGNREGLLEDLIEIQKGGRQAAGLVKQMLTFARQNDLRRRPVDLEKATLEVVQLLRRGVPSSIDIDVKTPKSLIVVDADQTQLHQVLMNLCTNAIQAMVNEKGRLEITLEVVDTDELEARRFLGMTPGSHALLTVSDNGIGIATKHLDRVIDPFFTTKGPDQGTGLGLSMVHGIVLAHGGCFHIESDEGVGTKASVYLPLADSPLGEATNSSPVPQNAIKRGRVLVVDDEEALVRVMTKSLSRRGIQVIGFTSSQDALAEYSKDPYRFDVAILDQTMPNMTGLELGKELIHQRPDMPVFLISGFSKLVDEHVAKRAGFREFFRKPIIDDRLERSVVSILDRLE